MPAHLLPSIWAPLGHVAGGQIPLNAPVAGVSHLLIQWTQCPSSYPSSIDCGQLSVPVNHDDHTDGLITLGMVRLNASSPSPLGNLVINPGGPGGSPVPQLVHHEQREVLSKNLTEYYNIIAPDPRGVGLSHPVTCDVEIFNSHVFSYITTQQELDDAASWNRALGESCAKMTGPAFYYLDTASAAKDLDLIRQVGTLYTIIQWLNTNRSCSSLGPRRRQIELFGVFVRHPAGEPVCRTISTTCRSHDSGRRSRPFPVCG